MRGGLTDVLNAAAGEKTGMGRDAELLPGAVNRPGEPVNDGSAELAPYSVPPRSITAAVVYARTELIEEAEYGHLFYWTPVLMGTGAAAWFSLDLTPAVGPLLFLCVAASLTWLLLGPWRPIARTLAFSVVLALTGALLAAWETVRRDTVLLDSPVTTTIRGIVGAREIDSTGRWRYEVRLLETDSPHLKRQPALIRVTAGKAYALLEIGVGISGRARLVPPSGPALSGLNDFAFDAYFSGIGASGYFYGAPRPWAVPPSLIGKPSMLTDVLQRIEALRGKISARIRSILPGDTGAFAASMVTDDRRAMSRETTEALRLAGLTHIIAISGLNMALAAGLCYLALRMLLSFSQQVSHSLPVKKIAAAGALTSVTLYYLISGFAVSAERAYVMMAIMLISVFWGRPSISLRNVALSAIAILILSPSALMGPGFQMSYAATLALVSGYSALQRRMAHLSPMEGLPIVRRLRPVWEFMAGVFLTSLIGGLSTALFSVEHFNRLATWGLPSNLVAMPIISFVVMPAALISLILMPFGLDWLPIRIMGYGLDVVIAVARWVAAQHGEWITGPIPAWFFVGMTLSLIVMAIMRSRLRIAGAASGAALSLLYLLTPPATRPDLILFEDGRLAAILTPGAIAVSESRPSSFILEQWQHALAARTVIRPQMVKALPKQTVHNKRGLLSESEISEARTQIVKALAGLVLDSFTCREGHWCVARLSSGLVVVIADKGGYAGIACDLADVVVTPVRLGWSQCRSGARLFTGETLRRSGSVSLFLTMHDFAPPDIVTRGAMQTRSRPWSRHRLYDWRSDTYAAAVPE